MTTNRRGRGPRGGRGRPPAAVRPREGDETSQTRATKELMPRPGTSSPSGGAEHDLFHACATGLRPSRPGTEPVPSRPGTSPPRALPSGGVEHDIFHACSTWPLPSRPGTEPVPFQDHVALLPSARPAVSYLEKLLCNITLKETSISSPILVRKPPDWYFTFYIRTDLQGYFHTYPTLGKPFKTLQEADNAINRHLHDLQDPKMSDDSLGKLYLMERAVQESIYWPDGTRRNCLEPPDKNKDEIHLLVQALVDRVVHFNSRMSRCTSSSFLRAMSTIISISLQELKELLILSLLKSNVHEESMRKWCSAVSALLNQMMMVIAMVVGIMEQLI